KSAYLWDLMKLFYIEIYDLLCAKVEILIYKKKENYFLLFFIKLLLIHIQHKTEEQLKIFLK
ncbi:hypothetical protein, partial [Aliarcobacter butzleri]|uniref:hypothetical protein n=1 Tax=Aliarcobacter butzleri TaxID=28197 RepID=UPI0021B650D4